MPLDDDDGPDGDGMIWCAMWAGHKGDHGEECLSERGIRDMGSPSEDALAIMKMRKELGGGV
jgi:hypothetical protein